MAKNDLNKPFDVKPGTRSPPRRRRPLVAPVLISAAVLVAIIAAFWIAVVDDPDGGQPVVVATIEDPVPAATGSVPGINEPAPPANADRPIMLDAAPPSPADEIDLASLPQLPPAVTGDPSLVEASSFGSLPRVSPDGRRPRDIYARRSPPVADGVPRIAIVVGGLGLSQTGTQKALDALPADVTLAFASTGSSLQRWVGQAREAGHEVLLQVPLEPLNYPEENPGEHTLLAASGPAISEELRWNLGRMTTYAGVMNHMGARFTQDERSLVPFLGEIGDRGLYYLDDGSSPQSIAPRVGASLGVPVVSADSTIDRDRSPDAIATALAGLESIARANGMAVGIASGFPASIDAVARWAAEAESRGIVLVPASAALRS